MNHKFVTGDIVVGNKGSNRYGVTSQRNGFVGKVQGYKDGRLLVEVISTKRFGTRGSIYRVDENFFQLIEFVNKYDNCDESFDTFNEEDYMMLYS